MRSRQTQHGSLLILSLALILLALLLPTACHHERPKEHVRSAYYWSTTWDNDSTMRQWLSQNGVSRIYLRYFDVVVDNRGEVMPNATLRFAEPVPQDFDIIPTVFIVNECLTHPTDSLDQLLLRRIMQITETHDVPNVHEIQIDCDWTRRTETTYFALLRRLRDAAHQQGIKLSATIRLHQLATKAPPVDRGVLMMYNTGDVRDLSHNPILDLNVAQPYMRHLSDYSLPLATAYPIFAWQLLVRAGRFASIMHSDDDLSILPGDTIIHREAAIDSVILARDAITRMRPDANDEIILFDISKTNIQRTTTQHYEKIYLP